MKVLVADDDYGSRLLAQMSVERLGHECRVAADGDEAWTIFQDYQPDVLVTDWQMPGLDGLQLCSAVRGAAKDRYTYIVLVTSLARRDQVLSGIEAGADDYVIKPLDPFALEVRLIVAKRVTSLHLELAGYRQRLVKEAQTDPLTKLLNRRKLAEDLELLHVRSERYKYPYSLALCDIDVFKDYNDVYGHQAGDQVLESVATTLTKASRQGDSLYRYGGEEFLIVLPNQAAAEAQIAVERFRAAVEDLGIEHSASKRGTVTISAGVSTFVPGSGESTYRLLRRADTALYAAKAAGRNCVVASSV